MIPVGLILGGSLVLYLIIWGAMPDPPTSTNDESSDKRSLGGKDGE